MAAQLDALQRNDWPEADAGVRAAFAFSKPADAETLLPGQVLAAVPLNTQNTQQPACAVTDHTACFQ